MKERITEAARQNNRSVNAEIVARLEASFAPPDALSERLEVSEKIVKNAVERILKGIAARNRQAGTPSSEPTPPEPKQSKK